MAETDETVRQACIAYNRVLLNQPEDERNQPKAMAAALETLSRPSPQPEVSGEEVIAAWKSTYPHALSAADRGSLFVFELGYRAAAAARSPSAPAGEGRLREACKPWEHHVGEPPEYDSPLSGVFGAGISYAHEQLAKLLSVEKLRTWRRLGRFRDRRAKHWRKYLASRRVR